MGAPLAAQELVIEEVTVTAQKREQSMQDVPLTVMAIGEDLIREANIQSVDGLQAVVPALRIYSATNPVLASIVIRGAGTGAADCRSRHCP